MEYALSLFFYAKHYTAKNSLSIPHRLLAWHHTVHVIFDASTFHVLTKYDPCADVEVSFRHQQVGYQLLLIHVLIVFS